VPTRYRCAACGNLTRFDVVTSRRARAFHHYTVGGELRVEEETVLDESVDAVSCRWCGTGASVEVTDNGDARALEAHTQEAPVPEAAGES
jgi:capsid portal protein